MKPLALRELVLCGLFIALITTGTFLKIPIGGDVYTLQFLFTLLAGLLLGPRLGLIAVGSYILLGLIGVPVFAMGGGLGYLAQPTFGYLLGFAVQAYFCGYHSRRLAKVNVKNLLAINIGGMAIVYLFGMVWFYVVSNYLLGTAISVWWVLLYCGILQLPPDFLLCLLAAWIAIRSRNAGLWLS